MSQDQVEQTVEITTLLGKGAHFDGKLTFEGTVRIDGDFSGRIESDDILVVGEGGLVRAELHVGSVIIEGAVEGDIHAYRSVEIHAPGRVKGNIITPSLFIDRGVIFEGSCQMIEAADAAGLIRGEDEGGLFDDAARQEAQTITAELPDEGEHAASEAAPA
ncbi:MAG: polymer-forming cytoskeletal protein [Myxococcales bacterium]|nr:polymer-forming cytoskeletal protein [Myxococcales bacterium]